MSELTVVICVSFDHRADVAGFEAFRRCITSCPFVDVAMEVTGSFDMILQGHIDSLPEYTRQMDAIRAPLAKYVTRLESNFVSKKIVRTAATEKCIWVPCEDGRKRIDIGLIDKVIAEGDYMRLFIGDWQCLIHATISALRGQLDERFMQLHRSAIVRIDFIDRLIHSGRRWVAVLNDGSRQAVAKSHVGDVAQLLSSGVAKPEPPPASRTRPATPAVSAAEPCDRDAALA